MVEFSGIKFIWQFLVYCRIDDYVEEIVIVVVRNVIRIKHMIHQFPMVKWLAMLLNSG